VRAIKILYYETYYELTLPTNPIAAQLFFAILARLSALAAPDVSCIAVLAIELPAGEQPHSKSGLPAAGVKHELG
jgi:hypothetical protein